jgi:hypothetical protein
VCLFHLSSDDALPSRDCAFFFTTSDSICEQVGDDARCLFAGVPDTPVIWELTFDLAERTLSLEVIVPEGREVSDPVAGPLVLRDIPEDVEFFPVHGVNDRDALIRLLSATAPIPAVKSATKR